MHWFHELPVWVTFVTQGTGIKSTREIGKEQRREFFIRAPWIAIRGCSDIMVKLAVLVPVKVRKASFER